MTPSEAPKALQASECSELLDPTRANCWISAQHQPGKFTRKCMETWWFPSFLYLCLLMICTGSAGFNSSLPRSAHHPGTDPTHMPELCLENYEWGKQCSPWHTVLRKVIGHGQSMSTGVPTHAGRWRMCRFESACIVFLHWHAHGCKSICMHLQAHIDIYEGPC